MIIKRFNTDEWACSAAKLIEDSVKNILDAQDVCTIVLTGGKSASLLYSIWNQSLFSNNLSHRIIFYIGDERCLSPNHEDSNYGMVMRVLFSGNNLHNYIIHPMYTEHLGSSRSVLQYENILPSKIDILLLGVGADGHIASLFPNSPAFNDLGSVAVCSPINKIGYVRLTITPKVIKSANKIFILALGVEKQLTLSKALVDPEKTEEFPIRLALHGTWLTNW